MNAKVGDMPIQLPQSADLNPIQLLQIAVQRGVDTEQLKQLMELQREWKAARAQEAFTVAMNAFRAKSIEIVKGKRVSFGNTHYSHALLSDVVSAVAPVLSQHGLSHRWETKQDGNAITVTCIITHELGHSISTSLTAPPDTSGSKNSIQAIGSTVTYLQRYSFLAITGLAAKDADDDGAGGQAAVTITDEQVADLEALMQEIGIVGERRERALKAWRVAELRQIAQKDYAAVCQQVESKRR
jgi:hypothetical protein